MDRALLEVVLALNPWLEHPDAWPTALAARLPRAFVPRAVYREGALAWATPDKAHLLVGPRQVGKSTLFWKHLESLGPRVLALTLEDARIRAWTESAAIFVRDLQVEFAPLAALVLDEVQHHAEAALFLKQVVDLHPGFPVLVTGSSAFHLQSRTRESLAGRATRFVLHPFSMAELLPADPGDPPVVRERRWHEVFLRHIRYGGYPEARISPTPEGVLGGLIEAFLDRDASDFFRIRRPDAMRKLLHLAAGQVGSLVNLTEWASLTGVSRETVQEYLEILANSHLVHLVPVFAGGRRAELTATPKVFLVDTGIRNALVRDFRPLDERQDAGATLENWVYGELVKNVGPSAQVRYWRTRSGAEVDFVVDDGSTPIGLEVKATALRRPALSRSARSFIEAYQPRGFLVVNRELEHEEVVAGTTVRWLRAETFGGDVRAAVLGAEAV